MQAGKRSVTFSRECGSKSTQFAITLYSNRSLVVISQTGSLGSVNLVKTDSLFDRQVAVDINTVLGKRSDPASLACCKGIAEEIANRGHNRPLVICLAFRDPDLKCITEAVNAVAEHSIWAVEGQ